MGARSLSVPLEDGAPEVVVRMWQKMARSLRSRPGRHTPRHAKTSLAGWMVGTALSVRGGARLCSAVAGLFLAPAVGRRMA